MAELYAKHRQLQGVSRETSKISLPIRYWKPIQLQESEIASLRFDDIVSRETSKIVSLGYITTYWIREASIVSLI